MPKALERKGWEEGEAGLWGWGERKCCGEAAPRATGGAGTVLPPRALGEMGKNHLWVAGSLSSRPFLRRRSLSVLRLETVDASGGGRGGYGRRVCPGKSAPGLAADPERRGPERGGVSARPCRVGGPE